MKFSVTDHVRFLSGYLDAVGRQLSSDIRLVTSGVSLIPDGSSISVVLDVDVSETNDVVEIAADLEKSISVVFESDVQGRLLFYLVEYVLWIERLSETCTCKSHDLSGERVPARHLAYTFVVDGQYEVLFFAFSSDRIQKNDV